jgi:hypothetical protein
MTVFELIKILQELSPEAKICIKVKDKADYAKHIEVDNNLIILKDEP